MALIMYKYRDGQMETQCDNKKRIEAVQDVKSKTRKLHQRRENVKQRRPTKSSESITSRLPVATLNWIYMRAAHIRQLSLPLISRLLLFEVQLF